MVRLEEMIKEVINLLRNKNPPAIKHLTSLLKISLMIKNRSLRKVNGKRKNPLSKGKLKDIGKTKSFEFKKSGGFERKGNNKVNSVHQSDEAFIRIPLSVGID